MNLISELPYSIVSATLAVTISVMIGRTAAVAVGVEWLALDDCRWDLEICVPYGFLPRLCCRRLASFSLGLERLLLVIICLLFNCFELVLFCQLVEAVI